MNDNVFKRKTKVIDDEDNEEIETPVNKTSENRKETHKSDEQLKRDKPAEKTIDKIKSGPNKIEKERNNINDSGKKGLSLEEKIKRLKNLNIKEKTSVDKDKKTIPSKPISSANKSKPSFVKKDTKRKREESDDDDSLGDEEESEDSSYSSNEREDSGNDKSSSSSESEEKSAPSSIKKKKTPIKTSTPVKKVVNTASVKKPKVLKTKSSLVNQLLKRWWFALPQWPPEDFDPSEKLQILKLRSVSKAEWKFEQVVDDKGFTKCIELDGYKFVYVDPSGKVHDLRPRESIPSYNNFINKSEKELYSLVIKALRNQLDQLQNGEKYCAEDYNVINNLKEELNEVESNFNRIK